MAKFWTQTWTQNWAQNWVSSPVLSILATATLVLSPLALPTAAIADPNTKAALSPYTLTQAQIAVLGTDVPVLDVWEGTDDRRIVEVFGAIDIDAAPAQIWEIMTNCEAQLKIISDMTKCIITQEDKAAGWDERLQVVNIGRFLPRVRSKFRSEYSPYREIRLTRTGGDLSVLDGLWNLTTTQDGQTRVTYRARLKPKLPVPRRIMQKATAKDMPKVLKNLRDLAESGNQDVKIPDTTNQATAIP